MTDIILKHLGLEYKLVERYCERNDFVGINEFKGLSIAKQYPVCKNVPVITEKYFAFKCGADGTFNYEYYCSDAFGTATQQAKLDSSLCWIPATDLYSSGIFGKRKIRNLPRNFLITPQGQGILQRLKRVVGHSYR